MRIQAVFFALSISLSTAAQAGHVIRWDFGEEETTPIKAVGGVHRDVPGPRPPEFPDFEATNTAARFDGNGARFEFADPGPKSQFDFENGDSITIEAWVRIDEVRAGENVYIVGKGRTWAQGFPRDNQNWALRLREQDGRLCVSFLFATPPVAAAAKTDSHWHRWTSKEGFASGTGWHHVAAAYRFGEPDSIRGWIDGKTLPGAWDMGGATKTSPVVDDDAIWMASSMGGMASNSLRGYLDCVAIHREILSDEIFKSRFRRTGGPVVIQPAPEIVPVLRDILPGCVVVTLHEGLPAHNRWLNENEKIGDEVFRWHTNCFLLPRLPHRFDSWGIRDSWNAPVLARIAADVHLTPGPNRILLRARGLSRLWIDGRIVIRSKPVAGSTDGHNPVKPILPPPLPGLRSAGYEMQEVMDEVTVGADGRCRVILETLIGGKGFRAEPGELMVAVQSPDENSFHLLQPADGVEAPVCLTDEAVEEKLSRVEAALSTFDDEKRRSLAGQQVPYWNQRHDYARDWVKKLPSIAIPGDSEHPIDAFLNAKIKIALASAKRDLPEDQLVASPLIDDAAFLRRAYLDTIGIPPTESEARSFLDDTARDKRTKLVDRLLNDDRWSDHWVSYWQDVLAENPNILKPSLNNSGPFRWYLHEALRDNRSFDRIVTELIMLRGSEREGGTAGFGMAADNDAPFAAKAHIIGTAFLGIELQCARCHDSPYHSTTQKDLFSMAAMMERKPVTVSPTSTVPAGFFEKKDRESLIKVTLKPKEVITPIWPFAETTACTDDSTLDSLMMQPGDSRERLATLITAPQNVRFPNVLVNRVWRRLIGAGFVEPAHDWEGNEASHPELLNWLSREFISSGYDLKHVTRLIMTSAVYQRQASGKNRVVEPALRFFNAPERRRLTAEQIVDSLYMSAGKSMDVEEITFDPDGRRPATSMISLGVPKRAWMLASLSNERDRPSLSLPRAQAVADVLEAFGWTGSRQNPRTDRESSPGVLQPGVLSNGTFSVWITRASHQSELARLALEASSPESLVDSIFLRFLARRPTSEERAPFVDALSQGFEQRRIPDADVKLPQPLPALAPVTWSNHLVSEANSIQIEAERRSRQGPPADPRLVPAWREVYEDLIWSVINIREFVWVP